MRVLIAGCGDVGNALGQRLVQGGDKVWGLRRNTSALSSVIHPIQADLAGPIPEQVFPEHLDAVCYAVAATQHTEAAYKTAYVDGVKNLLLGLERAGQNPRLLFVSSTSVYGQNQGEIVDEYSVTHPSRFSGRIMLEGEGLVREYKGESSSIRFAGIYGPGRYRLINLVKAGEKCRAEPPLYTNRIHRDDCAGVLAHLLILKVLDSVYVGVDSQPTAQCEIMDWLAKKLMVSKPERVSGTSMGKRCSNRRLLETGYRLLYPTYRQGYESILGA